MNYKNIGELLNVEDNMDIIIDKKIDDDVITVSGVDWFSINGKILKNLYISGNSFVGFNENKSELKLCNRDGAMYKLYRQEGILYNYYKFLKIRYEGYSVYSSTSDSYKISYELLFIDDGTMYLNCIQTPQEDAYAGVSDIMLDGMNYKLSLNRGKISTNICFNYENDKWLIGYKEIKKECPYDIKYLLKCNGIVYTIINDAIIKLERNAIDKDNFITYGYSKFTYLASMKDMNNISFFKWTNQTKFVDRNLNEFMVSIDGVPKKQKITSKTYSTTDSSIISIENIVANVDGDVLFSISFDGIKYVKYDGEKFVETENDYDGMNKLQIESIPKEAINNQNTNGIYKVKIVVDENQVFRELTFNYESKEV